jgi:hypothetical protein
MQRDCCWTSRETGLSCASLIARHFAARLTAAVASPSDGQVIEFDYHLLVFTRAI